jgi:regulator of replication initiation timing
MAKRKPPVRRAKSVLVERSEISDAQAGGESITEGNKVVADEVTEAPEVTDEQAEESIADCEELAVKVAELQEENDALRLEVARYESRYMVTEKKKGRKYDTSESRDNIMDALDAAIEVIAGEMNLAKSAGRTHRIYHMIGFRAKALKELTKRLLRDDPNRTRR